MLVLVVSFPINLVSQKQACHKLGSCENYEKLQFQSEAKHLDAVCGQGYTSTLALRDSNNNQMSNFMF